jgi:hypothetical protein
VEYQLLACIKTCPTNKKNKLVKNVSSIELCLYNAFENFEFLELIKQEIV